MRVRVRTLKKSNVAPFCKHPYFTSSWLAKSSTFLMGDSIRCVVKNAAKLAVYVDVMIKVKNHQALAVNRAEIPLKQTRNSRRCEISHF